MSGTFAQPAFGVMEGGFTDRAHDPAYGNIEIPALFGLIHSDAVRVPGKCPGVIGDVPMGGWPA